MEKSYNKGIRIIILQIVVCLIFGAAAPADRWHSVVFGGLFWFFLTMLTLSGVAGRLFSLEGRVFSLKEPPHEIIIAYLMAMTLCYGGMLWLSIKNYIQFQIWQGMAFLIICWVFIPTWTYICFTKFATEDEINPVLKHEISSENKYCSSGSENA